MVRGLPHLLPTTLVCTDCLNGKQHRDPIPKKSAWKATKKLQLIHADICGPVTPHQMAKRGMPYALLMILVEKHGFTS